jgi:deoxyribonuclease-4
LRPPIGAHVSTAGGIERALDRARELGYEAVQLFVKSPHQWRGPRLDQATVDAFRAARAARPVAFLAAHAAYLINLAALDRSVLRRSRTALVDELVRGAALGLDALIVHPGAHLGVGEREGLARAAESLSHALGRSSAAGPRLLIENTAGPGTVLGHRLEHLADLVERSGGGARLGLCLDTCHAFAAGYDLRTARGYERFWSEAEQVVGLGSVGCLHLNDSRYPQGSRRDRHANLGDGGIGLGCFRRVVRDPRLAAIPMVLETPRGDEGQGHARDFARLKGWRATR